MPSVEQLVKTQYAKVFGFADWQLFKQAAEAQLREAAYLKKSDMRFEPSQKLRARNSRKRLLIGVGVELLLKAIYLKNGFCINKLRKSSARIRFPFTPQQATAIPLDEADTYTLSTLIDYVAKTVQFPDNQVILKGLRIAKVFRNKEGHVVTPTHTFKVSNYRDIEAALVALYEHAFGERLRAQFSLAAEKPIWRVSHPIKSLRARRPQADAA